MNFENFDIFHIIVFLWPEYFIDFLCERWIPRQAVTSVLCLHYRDSTKDVYTSEITFLALNPWSKCCFKICPILFFTWYNYSRLRLAPLTFYKLLSTLHLWARRWCGKGLVRSPRLFWFRIGSIGSEYFKCLKYTLNSSIRHIIADSK